VPALDEGRSEEDPAWLTELLADIDLIIIEIGHEDASQRRHWKGLRRDLSLLARAARDSAPESAASILRAVIAAVETAICLYHVRGGGT